MMKKNLKQIFKKPKKVSNIATNNAGTPLSGGSSGMTNITLIERLFRNFKYEIEKISNDEKIQLLKMINDEYKVLLRKEKLKT